MKQLYPCMSTPSNIQHLSGLYLRLCSFPAGLGKGHDAGVLGSWLAVEVLRVDGTSIEPGSLPIPSNGFCKIGSMGILLK